MSEKTERIWIRVKQLYKMNSTSLSLSFDSRDDLSRFLGTLAYQKRPIVVTIGKK